jgi:hypothetical protein
MQFARILTKSFPETTVIVAGLEYRKRFSIEIDCFG